MHRIGSGRPKRANRRSGQTSVGRRRRRLGIREPSAAPNVGRTGPGKEAIHFAHDGEPYPQNSLRRRRHGQKRVRRRPRRRGSDVCVLRSSHLGEGSPDEHFGLGGVGPSVGPTHVEVRRGQRGKQGRARGDARFPDVHAQDLESGQGAGATLHADPARRREHVVLPPRSGGANAKEAFQARCLGAFAERLDSRRAGVLRRPARRVYSG